MDDIIKTLEKYNSEGKMADKAFVDRMCISLVREYDLHKYLKDVKVSYSKRKKLGSNYNPFYHVITINLEQDYNKEKAKEFGKDYLFWYNLEVTTSILHEMEHVRQEKTRIEKPWEFETGLIDLCDIGSDRLIDYLILYRTFKKYTRYHDLVPTERMANVRSGKAFRDVIDNITDNEVISSFRAFFNERNARQISAGYVLNGDTTNCPSFDYLRIIKCDNLKAPEELSFEKRLYLGLPLNKSEYRLISK